jgi:hypothetical protein
MEAFLKALRAIHPTRVDAGEVYMRFAPYWFAIGRAGFSVEQSQYERMLSRFARDLVWC